MQMLFDKFNHMGRRLYQYQCATSGKPHCEKREGLEWQNED